MADEQAPARFILDTVHLAKALESVSLRDWPDSIRAAARQGQVRFAELILRRLSVSLSPQDELMVDWLLEVIRARLKFLEVQHRRSLLN